MVASKNWAIVWDDEAKDSLKEIYEYISETSPAAAKLVRSKIISRVKELRITPTAYEPDRYCLDNSKGIFRAFEQYRYRVTYEIDEKSRRVFILRVRHTSRKPVKY